MIQGQDLKDVVDLGKTGTTIILDEFYSWYMYWDDKEKIGKSISGAEYVDDVNADSVILIDGMTKGPRLPGWRVCWVVGPKSLISAVSQSGSFLDGGANHPYVGVEGCVALLTAAGSRWPLSLSLSLAVSCSPR